MDTEDAMTIQSGTTESSNTVNTGTFVAHRSIPSLGPLSRLKTEQTMTPTYQYNTFQLYGQDISSPFAVDKSAFLGLHQKYSNKKEPRTPSTAYLPMDEVPKLSNFQTVFTFRCIP